MLPDEVLLEIFGFNVVEAVRSLKDGWSINFLSDKQTWQTLVHVCRRWRSVVFGSPRRLKLKLFCTTKTPVRDRLDVWPELPLVIAGDVDNVDNIIGLLECSDRINQINLQRYRKDILEAMEVSFPELTFLALSSDETEPLLPLPDSFLGGSVPRLQSLHLNHIPFPGLPKLLLSATDLTVLRLDNIPHSGYFSPEAMVACLSLLTNLDVLCLHFQSSQPLPDRESRRTRPPKRTVLPVLTHFRFRGVCEYLEYLVACVDSPRLNSFHITFFNDIVFNTPQFTQFISRTPTLEAFDKAIIFLSDHDATIRLSLKTSGDEKLNVAISCRVLDWQVSFLEQVCTSFLPALSALEDLYISEHPYRQPVWEDNIDSALWLELLRPFTTVKDLFLSEKIALRVVPALQELVGGRTIEVLPVLQNIFIEGVQPSGPVQEGVGKFVAARQVISHSIAVSQWDRDPSRMYDL